MREILFRGKRSDNGIWIEGHLFARINDCFIIPLPVITSKSLVDRETVGQFTGLTDKNGKKIFEGDIITASVYEREYEDEYLSNTPIKVSYCGGYFYPFHLDGCWRSGVSDIEIIGNIHDNPELLENT